MEMLIGTKNKFKREKLVWIVKNYFSPLFKENLKEVEEHGNNFLEIAQNKALAYSKIYNCIVISTDGGAVIPSLNKSEWEPIKTKRFGMTDQERITKLLDMMQGKKDRTVEWYEAMAVADKGKLLFSSQERALDGMIDKTFNSKYYREGIWLCSITSFSQFGDRNYFELSREEREQTEDSWSKLKADFEEFMKKTPLNQMRD